MYEKCFQLLGEALDKLIITMIFQKPSVGTWQNAFLYFKPRYGIWGMKKVTMVSKQGSTYYINI